MSTRQVKASLYISFFYMDMPIVDTRLQPHEDGPAFQPLVATISLGSHTVLDIHHYLSSTSPSPPMTTSVSPSNLTDQASPIAAIPLAHLLLLPRSLLIVSSSLYTSHLHGIAARSEDVVRLYPSDPPGPRDAVIANADLLGDATIVDSLRDTGRWVGQRASRTSLTFRHVAKVVKGGAFSMALGGLKRKG